MALLICLHNFMTSSEKGKCKIPLHRAGALQFVCVCVRRKELPQENKPPLTHTHVTDMPSNRAIRIFLSTGEPEVLEYHMCLYLNLANRERDREIQIERREKREMR